MYKQKVTRNEQKTAFFCTLLVYFIFVHYDVKFPATFLNLTMLIMVTGNEHINCTS